MIKFRITRIDDVVPMARWAYRIDDTDECKKFLKAMYGFDVEEPHYGQWFVCSISAQWTCPANQFVHYYRIIGAMKEEKLRKELFNERLDKAIQNIKNDIPSLYPGSIYPIVKNMRNMVYGWPTSCHLDIRDIADMRKEKAKEKTTMKTSITLNIKKVIFNDPATIVIWADGTKTVVKCKEGETYSKWAGLALCYAKRVNGEKFHAEFKRWCGEDEEAQEETRYSSGSAYSGTDSFAEIGKNARTCLDTLARAFNGYDGIDYRDVIFKDKSKAQSIIDDMSSVVRDFGNISLGNYCDMVGASHKLSDYYIGWTGSDKIGILTVKNGYKIILPEPGSIQPTVAADHVKNFDIESAID